MGHVGHGSCRSWVMWVMGHVGRGIYRSGVSWVMGDASQSSHG